MILYNVWFSFKDGADDAAELGKARLFFDDLKKQAQLLDYRLMKNRGSREKSKLPAYQVMAKFADASHLDLAMTEVARIGIHAGRHGAMIENVDEFRVEVFEDLPLHAAR